MRAILRRLAPGWHKPARPRSLPRGQQLLKQGLVLGRTRATQGGVCDARVPWGGEGGEEKTGRSPALEAPSSAFHTSARSAGLAKGLAGCLTIMATSALVPLYMRQDKLVYLPSKEVVAEPADWQLKAEDLWVESEEGVKIHSWLLSLDEEEGEGEGEEEGKLEGEGRREEGGGRGGEGQQGEDEREEAVVTLLFFHGNAGNISGRLQNCHAMLEALRNQEAAACKLDAEEAARAAEKPELGVYHLLRRRRFRVCAVDYRGYGLSEGEPSMPGIKKDAMAVLRAVTGWNGDEAESDPDDCVIVFGRSLGGAVALDLAASERRAAADAAARGEDPATVTPLSRIRGMVVENTFTSVRDVVDVHYPVLRPFKAFIRSDWDNVRWVWDCLYRARGEERSDGRARLLLLGFLALLCSALLCFCFALLCFVFVLLCSASDATNAGEFSSPLLSSPLLSSRFLFSRMGWDGMG